MSLPVSITEESAASAAESPVAHSLSAAVPSPLDNPGNSAPQPPEATTTEPLPATDAAAAGPSPVPASPERRPGSEIELKLLVDPERLADFNDAPIIAANASGKGTTRHLTAVYYDTPDRALRRAGLTLRVRQSGNRFVQTVKTDFGDDPLSRGEWESTVASIDPQLALALPLIPEELRREIEGKPLEPVFATDVRRRQRIVHLPNGTIEVAFDLGILQADGRSLPVSEIELELKDGTPAAIYELALRLLEHGPLRPSIRSKAARGFDLAADAPPKVRKPRKLRLDPSAPLDEAFAAILRASLGHLLQSIPGVEDGRDPEGVHQVRVALRQLRSALGMIGSVVQSSTLEALQADAKWLASGLGAARGWDVFLEETLPAVAGACPTIDDFDPLRHASELHRGDAYTGARAVLADPRACRFLIQLGSWIEQRGWRSEVSTESLRILAEPAIAFAGRALDRQHRKVLKRGRHFKTLSAHDRHRLRLAVKKLRYACDFLLPLFGDRKTTKRFAGLLADFQDELGQFNDMATTSGLLDSLGETPAPAGKAIGAILGWQAHRIASTEKALTEKWRRFAKAKTAWAADGDRR